MKINIHQLCVESSLEDEAIYITQKNYGEDNDLILIDPLQVDLLIEMLKKAKINFYKNNVEIE